jgi:hypothetical protein
LCKSYTNDSLSPFIAVEPVGILCLGCAAIMASAVVYVSSTALAALIGVTGPSDADQKHFAAFAGGLTGVVLQLRHFLRSSDKLAGKRLVAAKVCGFLHHRVRTA